jgi:hypothetical protein
MYTYIISSKNKNYFMPTELEMRLIYTNENKKNLHINALKYSADYSRNNSVDKVTGYGSRQGQGLFLLHRSSAALGPSQPPIRGILGALSPVVKRQEREADHSPPFSVEVKNDGAIPLPPSRLRGLVLN